MLLEHLFDHGSFALAHQARVYVQANELPADGAVHQCGAYRGIHAAGNGQQRAPVAHGFADVLEFAVNEGLHGPGRFAAANIDGEIVDHGQAIRVVLLREELQAVQPALFAGEGGGQPAAAGDGGKALWQIQRVHAIKVAVGIAQALEQGGRGKGNLRGALFHHRAQQARAHIAREQKRRAANGQDGYAELIDRLRAAARSIVGNVARVANHHDAAGILFPHHINGNRVGHDFAIHALAAHLAGNGLALGTAEIQDQDHIVAHGSFLTLLALRRALADDIKLAQNLFGNVHAQHGHDLQPIDHHIGKFLGDQRYALGIFPAHQRLYVLFFEPLEMLQHFRHFHGHGHGHVLGVLDAVVAPALITA